MYIVLYHWYSNLHVISLCTSYSEAEQKAMEWWNDTQADEYNESCIRIIDLELY